MSPAEILQIAEQAVEYFRRMAWLRGVEIEDLVQHAVLAIIESGTQYPGMAHTIGRRAAGAYLRKEQVRQRDRSYPSAADEQDDDREAWIGRRQQLPSPHDHSLIDDLAAREFVGRLPAAQSERIADLFWSGGKASNTTCRAMRRMRAVSTGRRLDDPPAWALRRSGKHSAIEIADRELVRACYSVVISVSPTHSAEYLEHAKWNRTRIRLLQEKESTQPSKLRDRIILYLGTYGPTKMTTLAKQLNVKYRSIYDDQLYLVDRGELVRLEHGVISLPAEKEVA